MFCGGLCQARCEIRCPTSIFRGKLSTTSDHSNTRHAAFWKNTDLKVACKELRDLMIPCQGISGVKTLSFLESIMQAGNSVQVEAGVACDRFMCVEQSVGIPPSYAYCNQCLERFWKYRVVFCSSQKSAQHQSV